MNRYGPKSSIDHFAADMEIVPKFRYKYDH